MNRWDSKSSGLNAKLLPFDMSQAPKKQGSLKYYEVLKNFGGIKQCKMYGKFEGKFPSCIVWVGNMMNSVSWRVFVEWDFEMICLAILKSFGISLFFGFTKLFFFVVLRVSFREGVLFRKEVFPEFFRADWWVAIFRASQVGPQVCSFDHPRRAHGFSWWYNI